jgi:hypothetical protein
VEQAYLLGSFDKELWWVYHDSTPSRGEVSQTGRYLMDFHEVENKFQELKNKLEAGTIDEDEFEAELRSLYVADAEGRYWMIGAQTGHWYYYDGTQWVQATHPEEEMRPPTETRQPRPAPVPSDAQPTEAAAAPRGKREIPGLLIPVVIGLVALCCILGLGSVVASEFLLPERPIGSLVGRLLGRGPARPSPVSTLEPSATPGLSPAEYIRAGDELFANGRYEEAVTQYQMAVSLEPQNAEAYARLGEAHLQMGNCDQAIPEFQQALALDPDLESAQGGLMQCGGTLPPEVSFASYSRSDLNFSLLYPSTWSVREEELQTIFAAQDEDIDFLIGNIFFVSSLRLTSEEEGMDNMGALVKARQLINLPMGSQLGGVDIVSLAGWEWATVAGEITGLQTPTTIYIAATVKDSSWYGVWAVGPTVTWEQTSWPIFRTMVGTVQLEAVVAAASPSAEVSPIGETPSPTGEASPEATGTPIPTPTSPTPTSPPGPSPTPTPPGAMATPTTAPATATPRPPAPTLSGKIAYAVYLGGQRYEVRIATVSGAVLQTIPDVSEPSLRPDGAMVAVRSWEGMMRALLVMNVDGGGRQRITHFLEDSVPRWAPDHASIVFGTKREGPDHVSKVYTYGITGDERALGEGDTPDWSPDGQRIVAKGTVSGTGLIVMDSGGGSRRQLTGNLSDSSPDWSPSGNKIAFMRETGGNWDIWAIDSDGTGETRLTDNGSIDGLPAWSPNGASIAFLSNRDGTWSIWAMNADGSNERKLFDTGCRNYGTGPFDGECAGRDCKQPRDWYDEQISWSR